ncbi:MAG TPA: glutamine--fructose-6-phosphate transaminase (isomerizing) [Chlamydiales bacterium]|nr:glutamine--fructose-6-phosphate transaminase (isomerizing) [Chlamydiales bacterium]
MCGIFGYVGDKDSLKMCLAGLEQLEYRGYDSTGIAGIAAGEVVICKEAGKLSRLKEKLELNFLDLAIGHTRWATHGKVNNLNAHPHRDTKQEIALVHNGIIENYDSLRDQLKRDGVSFLSETDTEVIVQLIAKHYLGDLVKAVHKTVEQLKGIFAIALIHKNHPDQIIAAARECPLSIGCDDLQTESIISSDPNAFLGSSLNVLFLRNNEVARVKKGNVEVFNGKGKRVAKKTERLDGDYNRPSKEGFDHFMLKEIYEQPSTIQKAILGRFDEGDIVFESLGFTPHELKKMRQVWLLGCGTSWHAGLIGSLFLEDLAHIPASAEIASEARYRIPILSKDTLVIAISQSGETADTMAAVREVKAHGCKVLGICNVKNSALTREADGCILQKAGPEVSVCSTKAFTSQIAVLALFAAYMARLRGMTAEEARNFYEEAKQIPGQIEQVLERAPEIQKIAKKYSRYEDFFFMGRRYMYPTCMEAALKLKEISYANANGYPGGELKHGPIALINPLFPVVAFCANRLTEDKIVSNLMEVKARGAPVLVFAPETLKIVSTIADDVFWLPPTRDELAPFASTVAGQLLAYYIAKERGCDIDQPRNLAKSVTVE